MICFETIQYSEALQKFDLLKATSDEVSLRN